MVKEKIDIDINSLIGSIICWLITCAWIILIFFLSSENATESSARSLEVLHYLEQIFGKNILNELMLRKITHVLEFSFLTLISFLAVRFTNNVSTLTSYAESPVKIIKSDNEMYIAISMWLSFLVAVLDEYHQLFVDGRSGSILDVAIDGIGIIVVLIIIRVIFTIYLKQLGAQEVRYE
ncbi:MAG: VanZ family protein [Saccharofermentans sp.]|nr:VanZ family protein [Saccharofermentans sp.]